LHTSATRDAVAIEITLDALDAPVPEPIEIPLMRIGMVSSWELAVTDGSHSA
jgi:hypothetical protein